MRLLKKLEDIFAAVAFAEAGEFETARKMLKEAESGAAEGVPAEEGHRDRESGKEVRPTPVRT